METNKIPFLSGGGEMGALTQNFDWDLTPVGNPDSWPQSLRTTVSIILLSKFPMFLWWGKELVQFYNDAYRPSLGNDGKHPKALGQRAEQCWPEIWTTIKPLIDQVVSSGVSTWSDNQLIPIFRNGRIEDVYWTFGYSAVLDEKGEIGGVLVVCQEVTQTILWKKQLEESEARFRSIVEQAPLAIGLLSGPDMIVGLGNDSIFQVWGKDKSIIGARLIDALPEIKNQGFIELLNTVYLTGEPYIGRNSMVRLQRRGVMEDVYFDFVYSPIRIDNGEIMGVLILAIDVTQQVLSKQRVENSEAKYRTLSEELEQQVQKRTFQLRSTVNDLERSNENLQQFAYVASHDLQEPLRKIQSFGSLLKRNFPDQLSTGVDYIDRMQSAAMRMSTLIEDLLSYSRVPVLKTSVKAVSLKHIVQRVIVDLELSIEQTAALITVEDLPIIKCDASQLGQLFQNLLSNALKFRKPGVIPVIGIRHFSVHASDVVAHVKPSRIAEQYYRIDVTDNGIGFDNTYREKIFQVFHRLHGKSEFAGSGIGLSICEKIVSNHGGAIAADSLVDIGSTFSVYLPVDQ